MSNIKDVKDNNTKKDSDYINMNGNTTDPTYRYTMPSVKVKYK